MSHFRLARTYRASSSSGGASKHC